MLKNRDLSDCLALYDLMIDPAVFPYVRHKVNSYEEYLFLTKQQMEAEERGDLISRTIVDEWGTPIGTINLFDIEEGKGFLGTWIGTPFHGKGYNQRAKEAFFDELFFQSDIKTVFMRINVANARSKRAAEKIPYVVNANERHPHILETINQGEKQYHLFEIERDAYLLHAMRENETCANLSLEA